MDIEILRPFGPSIVKVQLPLEIINQMNNYTDTIVKDQNKLTELDHGKKLVGNVQQEIVLEVVEGTALRLHSMGSSPSIF